MQMKHIFNGICFHLLIKVNLLIGILSAHVVGNVKYAVAGILGTVLVVTIVDRLELI